MGLAGGDPCFDSIGGSGVLSFFRILRQRFKCPDDEVLGFFGGNGQLMEEIVGERGQDEDETKEYRVQVDTEVLMSMTEAGLKRTRTPEGKELALDEDGDGEEPNINEHEEDHEHTPEHQSGSSQKEKKRLNPRDPLRVWIPAELVDQDLVKDYKNQQEKEAGWPGGCPKSFKLGGCCYFSGLSQQKTQTFLVAEKETGSPGEEDDGRAGEKRGIIIAPCVWFYKVVFGGPRSCTRARVVILGIGLFWVLLHHCIYSSQANCIIVLMMAHVGESDH